MSVGFLVGMAVLAAASIGVDQWTKWIVLEHLAPVHSMDFIPGFLRWVYVENRGAAFGMLQNQRWLFLIITVVMLVFCVRYLLRGCESKWMGFALTLIIGGGIGNMIDRIFRGFVVDFISVSFFPPVFNVADICVVVGAFLLIGMLSLSIVEDWKKEKLAKAQKAHCFPFQTARAL